MKHKRSIIPGDQDDTCYICGKHGMMDVHHMLHGPYRKMADHYRLTVHLCKNCHRLLHDTGLNDRELQRLAQKTFEKEYGHDRWMDEFGKSWLE